MFLRTVKSRIGNGTQYEYVRLVESYREAGKNKQRVVANLGRKDLLACHLDSLVRILQGESKDKQYIRAGEVEAAQAWDWGPVLVARELWQQLALDKILFKLGGRSERDRRRFAERAFVLCANRLCEPTSEHGLARWLETDFVCDGKGRRFAPQWRDEHERLASRSPRVRVKSAQLGQWYRTLDKLSKHKEAIEKELFLQLRQLFSLEVDFALYDVTSTYFEGRGPEQAKHGYSRDGKPRARQILVGLVMVDGWPIAHHIFRGNMRDSETVPKILEDLKNRFGLRRVVFVGDRGMITSDNLALIREREQGYVLGLQKRRSARIHEYIEKATGPWQECPAGITARESSTTMKTTVQEVDSGESGVRVFVVHSDERLEYERAQREKSMERVRQELQGLRERVAKGRLNAPEKIGAAAGRILARNHGTRYFDWKLEEGQFHYFKHPVNFPREQAYEGKYVIQTEEKNLGPIQAVSIYKSLSEVERAFSSLKDVIDMRPIHHKTDKRAEAHIQVAALAFLLHRALDKRLDAAGLDLSATEALQALRSVRLVEIDLGNGRAKRSVARGSQRAARIVKALGISELDPPTPQVEDASAV
jgi:transposase